MSIQDYKDRKHKPKKRRAGPILGGIAIVVVVVAVIAFYETQKPVVTSGIVYCGVFEYIETTADTVMPGGVSTSTVTLTMTTAVSYTTTTSVTGPVGHSYSNVTTTTNAAGFGAGVETICKYILSNSTSSVSSSSSSSG